MNRTEIIAPELPLDRKTQSPNGNGSAEQPPEIIASILLVDDRADKLMAVEAILSSLGQNIVKARSGKEALRHLLRQEFAVILLDVSMPCMDEIGRASCRERVYNLEGGECGERGGE